MKTARAAGTVLISPAGRVLLVARMDGGGWCQPGGMMEDGEDIAETAYRELHEETGYDGCEPWTDYVTLANVPGNATMLADDAFSTAFEPEIALLYVVYLIPVAEEFEPSLNEEHYAFVWTSVPFRYQLHPGTKLALEEML